MRHLAIAFMIPIMLLAASCLPTPPPELLHTPTPKPPATSTPADEHTGDLSTTPVMVEIGGRMVSVDRIIEGFLCNDSWQGTIYVSTDVEVNPWTEEPIFLRDCDLRVSEGTVVHVASHPGEVFYKGCTCHQ
jgi:hypothetical protein